MSDDEANLDDDSFDEDFSLDAVVQELAETTAPDRALSLARMLVHHAFGEAFGMTSCEFPERVFPVEDWDETQRRVLQAITDCEVVWPDISFTLHMSLDLDFDPERQELADALAGKQKVEEPEDAEEVPTDFSESAVLAAVERLYESFALKRRNLSKELKRFEPFLPHSSLGVDFLVDRLTAAKTLKERKSAAWALGRLGPHAAAAVPALLEQMEEDPENDYTGLALEEIPIDDETIERICDRLEGNAQVTGTNRYFRILGDRIGTERLFRWLNASADLRWQALSRLSARCPDRIRDYLLVALEDEDENFVYLAGNALGNAATCEWYFAELDMLSPAQRSAIADAFRRNRADLSAYRSQLFATVRSLDDAELAAKLLWTVSAFPDTTAGDVDACVRFMDLFATPEWKLELISLLRSFHSCGLDEQLIAALGSLLDDPNPYVRAAAVKALGRFPGEGDEVVELLQDAWSDDSELVKRAVLWNLAYRGPAACDYLLAQLRAAQTDRITAELCWALSAQGYSAVDLAAACPALNAMPLAENVIEAVKHGESRPT